MPGAYDLWDIVGQQLQDNYNRQYLTPELFIDTTNPMAAFVCPQAITEFFGTKVLNFCIINFPYGWQRNGDGELEDHWDTLIQPQIDVAVQKHKDTYNGYAQYRTLVYIDMHYAQLQEDADPESRAREMLAAVGGRMETICGDLSAYGWEYKGTIDSAPEWTFFQQDIDEFYGIQS